MRAALAVLLLCFSGLATAAEPSDADQQAEQQAELDRRCEAARAEALEPIRADIYKECLEDKRGDEAYCQRYADGYNGDRIGGSPRFYELPECEAAFTLRNRHRN
ncbi:MAG: hypothetical protein ABIX37_04460 [Gammaproteobacteria bacterium]